MSAFDPNLQLLAPLLSLRDPAKNEMDTSLLSPFKSSCTNPKDLPLPGRLGGIAKSRAPIGPPRPAHEPEDNQGQISQAGGMRQDIRGIHDASRALRGWWILTWLWEWYRVLLLFSDILKPSLGPHQHSGPDEPVNPSSNPPQHTGPERPVSSPSDPPQHTGPERPVNPSSGPSPPGPAGSGTGGSAGGGIGDSHNQRVRNFGAHAVNRRPIMAFGAHSSRCSVDNSHYSRTVHNGGVKNYGAHGVNNWENATFS